MKIISHRGFWKNKNEKNKGVAFHRSFKLDYGTETDFRDLNGELVISHDTPHLSNFFSADKLGQIYSEYNNNLILAINIKSDGIHNHIKNFIEKYQISNYFVFDMSIPDTFNYINNNLKVFIRQSEFEKDLPFYPSLHGIWLDSFNSVWYTENLIKKHLEEGKKVAIVSSELHNRDHLDLWGLLKSFDVIKNENLILCTDLPEEATNFFKHE